MTDKPNKQLIDVTFYKRSGKYYGRSYAIVNHFLFEEEFKQDIVDTQKALMDGWQEGNDFYVVTTAPKHVNGFYESIFMPGAFAGYKKQGGECEESIMLMRKVFGLE